MRALREWTVRLWSMLRPGRHDADLEAELRAHLALAADEGEARGSGVHGAGVAQAMESMRDQRGVPALESLARDLRHAARALRRTPTFALVTAATLAVAMAANTTVFSMIDGVLLAPLPYPDAERVVAVWNAAPGAPGLADVSGDLRLSDSMYFTYADHNRVFDAIGIWGESAATVTGHGEPEQVRVVAVSDGVLQALGVAPRLGRALTADDQLPGAARVVLLTYGYWERHFGGDPAVVGQMLTIDSMPRQIVGVMPRGFAVADARADLISAAQFDRKEARLPGFGWQAIARLKRGVTIAQADADIARLLPVWMSSWPAAPGIDPHVYEQWRITPAIRPLKDDIVGAVGPSLWALMGTAALVLLIACTNVATLVLVRTDERRQELAIRAALGASRARIVRALGSEVLLLALAAAIAGVLLSVEAVKALVAWAPFTLPRATEVAVGSREIAFTLIVGVAVALVIGILPALRPAAAGAPSTAGAAGRAFTESRARQRSRNVLIVAQLAMAVVVLIASGLMLRSFRALHAVEPGFTDAAEQLTLPLSIPAALAPTSELTATLERQIVERLQAIPGVTAAGFATTIPMEGTEPDWDVIVAEGQSLASGAMPPLRFFKQISPGLLAAQGTRIVAGRDFTWDDMNVHQRGVLVSANLARELWGSPAAAIGRRIQTLPQAPWHEVIGVVEDVRENGVQEPAPAVVYWPAYGESPYRAERGVAPDTFTLIVRSPRAGTDALLRDAQRAIWSVRLDLAVFGAQTMEAIYERSMARTSFTLATLLLASVMALALGLIGVYGVVAYAVSRRTREMGIRLALGGPPRALVNRFVRWGMVLAAVAIPIGMLAAAALMRLIGSLLYGVGAIDPATYAGVTVILALAAAVASYLPARRIASLDPVRTLNAP